MNAPTSDAQQATPDDVPSLSVIVPVYNEEDNVVDLCTRLFAALDRLDVTSEVVMVDDGSRDATLARLREQAVKYPTLHVVSFRRNFGQTAAMMAAIDHSRGKIIVSIDADLQNEPDDIAALLSKMEEGFDVVSGWRKERKDAAIRRNFVSRVANRLISWISGVHLHDYGCTLKAYRRDVLDGVRLYGEMHRFIPIYATWMGAKVTEIPVRHYPRLHGQSKYGLERIVKVVLDLIVVKFLDRYFVKPIYLFGGFGIFNIVTALLIITALLVRKAIWGAPMILTPLPTLAAIMFLLGCMSVLMGLVAEILVRTYFESQSKRSYAVREIIGNTSDEPNKG